MQIAANAWVFAIRSGFKNSLKGFRKICLVQLSCNKKNNLKERAFLLQAFRNIEENSGVTERIDDVTVFVASSPKVSRKLDATT